MEKLFISASIMKRHTECDITNVPLEFGVLVIDFLSKNRVIIATIIMLENGKITNK